MGKNLNLPGESRGVRTPVCFAAMTLQNRVNPWGELVARPERGTLMGNRGGRLHDNASRTLGLRRWASRQWIACVLEFKGRHRVVMSPNRYTELFFLDDATALAAGHRPCFECRRDEAIAFAAAWQRAFALARPPLVAEMDRALQVARTTRQREKVTYRETLGSLPDGVMVEVAGGKACLLRDGRLYAWTFAGYEPHAMPIPAGEVVILTPKPIVAVLATGYRPRGW